MSGPLILYYDPLPMADRSRLGQVAKAIGAALKVVSRRELGRSLGALAGLPGSPERAADYAGPAPSEPVLVLCGFLPHQLDAALDALREAGLSVPLKAVLTQANRTWPMERLARALQAERDAMARQIGS